MPATSSVDGTTIVDLTLLDSSQITLAYPDNLDLTSKGLVASSVGTLDGERRSIEIHYGTVSSLIQRLERNHGPGEHVRTYADGRGRGVERWEFPQDSIAYLTYSFGSWTAYVWDGVPGGTNPQLSETAQEIWSRNLHGTVNDGGYLVLGADPPLQLVAAADAPGPDAPDIQIDGTDGGLGIFLSDCDRLTRLDEESYGGPVYARCDQSTNTLVFVFAEPAVQEELDRNLQVTNVALPTADQPSPYVADGSDGGCGIENMPAGWQDQATKHGPLWLWHVGPPGEGDSGEHNVKTIAILESGASVTLTVPDTYRHRVAHLFDPTTWNQSGSYRLADGGRSVTFLPCESEPAQFVGGFVFRGEPCVEFDVVVDTAQPFTTAVPLGPEPCPESLHTRSSSDCPAAAPTLTGGADGLPKMGQTSAPRVERVLEASRETLLQAYSGAVDARMIERNGQVWDGPGDGVYTIAHVADYQIEVLLEARSECPTAVQVWNGVPLVFNFANGQDP